MKVEILLTNNEVIVFEPKWINFGVGLSEMLTDLNQFSIKVFQCIDINGVTHFINMDQVIRISEHTENEYSTEVKIDGKIIAETLNKYIQQNSQIGQKNLTI